MGRAKLQEHLAVNLIACSIAQDVARLESSEPLLSLAVEYGEVLKKAVKEPTSNPDISYCRVRYPG
jgi:hypothetical protein